MSEETLMQIMNSTSLIPAIKGRLSGIRTIYESSGPRGHFFVDYSAYGGTKEEVPRELIDRLEAEGKLVRAFQFDLSCNAWRLP